MLRSVLLVTATLAFAAGHLTSAIVVATLVVAVGTPTYPALAAALPATARTHREQATTWLVTFELSAFVVGPDVGGLLLGAASGTASLLAAAALAVAASVLLVGVRVSDPAKVTDGARCSLSQLARTPTAVRVIGPSPQ